MNEVFFSKCQAHKNHPTVSPFLSSPKVTTSVSHHPQILWDHFDSFRQFPGGPALHKTSKYRRETLPCIIEPKENIFL